VIQFRHVDVFAFLDADSPEAKAFTTNAGYLEAIAELITTTYGRYDPYPALLGALDHHGRLTRLRSRPYRGEAAPVASLLINAWLSERDRPARLELSSRSRAQSQRSPPL
jgi:hypothetical protein